jgi:hypothetical protein
VFVASLMQHTLAPGPLSSWKRCCIIMACRTNGLAHVCCIDDATHLEPGPLWRGKRCCITVAWGTNRLASVCCIGDATHYGSGPLSRGKRCCITVACGTKGLVSASVVASLQKRAHYRGRGEMLHHCGLQNEWVSECLLHR